MGSTVLGERGKKKGSTNHARQESKRNQVEVNHSYLAIRPNVDGTPLMGKLVNLPQCWRITPAKTGIYAVAASLEVRHDWMLLSEPTVSSGKSRLGRMLKSIWKLGRNRASFHHEAFEVLLNHLVKLGHQNQDEVNYASLSIDGIVVSPSDDPLSEIATHLAENRSSLVLPADKLYSMFSLPKEKILKVLQDEGVAPEVVDDLRSRYHIVESSAVSVEIPKNHL